MVFISNEFIGRLLAVLVPLAFVCCPSLCEATVISGNQITWRFTARDFLPAACFYNFTLLEEIWSYAAHQEEWGYTDPLNELPVYPNSSDLTTANRYRGNASEYCPIWNDIADGKYSGHPDFETSTRVYQDGCPGVFDFLTDPTNNGIHPLGRGSISKIVDNSLEFDESGIPKPVYCQNPPYADLGDYRCGWGLADRPAKKAASSGEEYFRMWYRDVEMYNLRVGFQLNLTINETTNTYGFASGARSFHPLNQFAHAKPCLNTGLRLDCSNGGRIFPLSALTFKNETENATFGFTVESHFFFDFQGNETFTFTGDDDFYVFINEKLAVDVGGLHAPLKAKIDLSVPAVREVLGLEVGGTYAFDLFHAERHTGESNFAFETSFRPKCNVVQSGVVAYSFDPVSVLDDWKFVGGPTWGIFDAVNGNIKLTDENELDSASYVFLKQQINMGTGFVAEFLFTSTGGPGEGFVFVIQRDSIVDKNGGTGGNLGFKNTRDSVGIVFDFCANRDDFLPTQVPDCRSRELRMHSAADNNASNKTKLLRSPLLFPNHFNDGQPHRVTIRYFGIPDWLEVLVDNDLFLQKRGFNLPQALGGRNAFVGFTASTGSQISSTIRIHDFLVKTVAIRNGNSKINITTVHAPANGKSEAAVPLTNYDSCGNKIQFGGYANLVGGVLISTTSETRIYAKAIEDPDTGVYFLKFSHDQPELFHLNAWFGNESLGCNETTTSTTDDCFHTFLENAVEFDPVVPPTPEQSQFSLSLRDQLLIGFLVTAGAVFMFGCFAVLYVLPARRQWLRDKKFIEAGRLAALENGIVYEGDMQIEIMSQKLQRVLEQLSRMRANRLGMDSRQDEIDALLRERGELQEQLRQIKMHKAELENTKNMGGSGRLANLLKPLTPKNSPKKARSQGFQSLGSGSDV